MAEINREHKDRLFKFIFGNPLNKEWTLSLYNAVNGSHYTDASAIRLNTIQDAVYMSMKNDISFFIGNTVNIQYGNTKSIAVHTDINNTDIPYHL